jgi:hypothetical protein
MSEIIGERKRLDGAATRGKAALTLLVAERPAMEREHRGR